MFSGLLFPVSEWKSKGLSNEKFKSSYTADKGLSPKLPWNESRISAAFTPNNVVNLFIVYELDTWSRDLNTDFTLKDCLFEDVKLTKKADPDK